MKILIYGSNGWIGQQFKKIIHKLGMELYCGKSRVDNVLELTKEIEHINPTHIISFIGRTHGTIQNKVYTTIDYLEQEGKLTENVRDNLFSPLLLADISKKKGIHYTYLGTGCIFKFDDDHPFGQEQNGFTEDSLPNFFGSSYSIVKGFTDQLMHQYNEDVLNLRIRMPITGEENSRNFITKILNYEKICSVPNSMTVLPELLEYVVDMMKNKLTGTVNLTNPGLISHNEILEMYKEIVDPDFTWNNFSQEEQRAILDADRSNNFLDTTLLERLYPQVSNIKDAVRNCLLEYKECVDNKINILITGGYGFIGSNFINYYFPKKKINKCVNIDAMYYCALESNVNEKIRNDPRYVFIKGNLRDTEFVTDVLKNHKITHVIHFAAQSHVQSSFEDSIKFTHDNIVGTHILLECVRKYNKIKKFIHVSTDEVYGESMLHENELHKTEQSILCPTNPYAATKAGAELIAQSYRHSYNMPIIITRGNNVYGQNQYPEKLIPKFIKLLKENKKVTVQGTGDTVRGFLHAYDTVKAFETILEKGEIGEIYNIGCDEGMEYSVMDIAKILIKLIKKTDNYEEWIEYIEDRPYNDMRYYISNQKIKDLGWTIEIDLMDGLIDLINTEYKINLINLKRMEQMTDKLSFFGEWINNIDELQTKFTQALPFEHIIIPNFLNETVANELYELFPEDITSDNWHKYYNPIEVKYANDNINKMPDKFKDIFYLLSTKEICSKFSKLSNIEGLEPDPYLHGAGLHILPRNGRLHLHLDYEKHPFLNKERRLNLIVYLTKDWNSEWNGDTQLWNKTMDKCVVKSPVIFNTAIIFKTNEISWHGLPEKITCPEGVFRKSLAYYFISPLESEASKDKVGNDGSGYRTKATFTKRPEDPSSEHIDKLYKIRPHRLINETDMNNIPDTWL